MVHGMPAVPPAKRPRGRPRKTADERDDGNRRHALLQAAAALFRQKGFAATSTRDIAAAAGMQSGSPFYHFKSKDALLLAVMEEGMRTAIARQEMVGAQHGFEALSPSAQLRCRIQAHFEVLLGPGNDFIPVMLYEQRSLSPSQHKALGRLVAQYEAMWTSAFTALHEAGALKLPVKFARLFILGALNWSVQWFDPTKEATLQDLSDAAIALFLKEHA